MTTRSIPITISGTGTATSPALRLTYPDNLSEDERVQIRERIQRMFSTQIMVSDFYEHMLRLPKWPQLVERLYGLRPIQDADLFESMVKIIIGQQLNVQFAATLVDRLVDLGGEFVEWNGTLLPVFPSPEQVAGWAYEQLRARSFSQRKAECVIDFARLVVNGNVDLEGLWKMSDDQIYEQLIPLRGIGRWTVECFLLFGLGRPDILPAADIGVQNAVQRLYGMDQRPKEEDVRRLAEPWAPWRSYATYYLWQSLIVDCRPKKGADNEFGNTD
ncbi:MAG: DNA-3-methyladenine glycosylase [Alicyclobacillus herbarius]|uniref:DNA-3-methyladenine glycosylase family protein n=1 Tax=Alicyclobacillus herbarius TaxID=122960 RepID=UPI0023575FEA|nr:DNA-3-methyladenine glycosylase [Alicyclobacillus herbarius]MCL6633213.1 DNA-3-methyladenine glycosylase [Alicyclobacillus herbarius]